VWEKSRAPLNPWTVSFRRSVEQPRSNDWPCPSCLSPLVLHRLGQSREAAETKSRADQSRERIARKDQLMKLMSKRPDDPEPRWWMGQAAVEGEMYQLAYHCFQAALDLDPRYHPAREALVKLRTEKGFVPEGPGGPSVRPTARMP
jgi:hypothetical protein